MSRFLQATNLTWSYSNFRFSNLSGYTLWAITCRKMTISLTPTPNFAQFLFELLTLNGTKCIERMMNKDDKNRHFVLCSIFFIFVASVDPLSKDKSRIIIQKCRNFCKQLTLPGLILRHCTPNCYCTLSLIAES
jgi:hypothetical protein